MIMEIDKTLDILVQSIDSNGLHDKLKFKSSQLEKCKERCVLLNDRIILLREHEEQASQTFKQNQDLQSAVNQKLESESCLYKMLQNEKNYIHQKLKHLKTNIRQIDEKLLATRRYLAGKKQQLNDLRDIVQWESDSCKTWLNSAISNEENTLSIIAKAAEDISIIKSLELQLQSININVQKWKLLSDKTTDDQLLLQMKLKRVAEDFSNSLAERDKLIKQWEQCVYEMENQDKSILRLGNEIEKTKEKIAFIKDELSTQDHFLDEENKMAAGYQEQISLLNSSIPNLLETMSELGPESQLEKELEALKFQIRDIAFEENSLRKMIQDQQKSNSDQNNDITKLEVVYAKLEKSLKEADIEVLSCDQELDMAQAMIQHEINYRETLNKEIEKIETLAAEKNKTLENLDEERKIINAQIISRRMLYKTIDFKVNETEEKLSQLQTTLNDLECKENDMKKRLSWVKGSKSRLLQDGERNRTLELKSLREIVTEKSQHSQLLEGELQKTKKAYLRAVNDNDKSKLRNQSLKEEAYILEKSVETILTKKRTVQRKKEEMLIESSLLQVEVRRLQLELEKASLKFNRIKNEEKETHIAIRDKLNWSEEYNKVIRIRKTALCEQKQRTLMQFQKASKKLQTLSCRQNALCFNSSKNRDEIEDPNTLIRKAEQEKERLRKQNQDLRNSALRNDRDLEVMRNTLDVFENANHHLREKCKPTAVEEKEMIKHLEDKLHSLLNELYEKQQKSETTRAHIKSLSEDLDDLQKRDKLLESNDKKLVIEELLRILSEKEQKITELDKMAEKTLHDIAGARKTCEISEVDNIKLRLALEIQTMAEKTVNETS